MSQWALAQGFDPHFHPGVSTLRVLMQEMRTTVQLLAIQGYHEVQVFSSFGYPALNFVLRHLSVVHPSVPQGESGARRCSNDPSWLQLVDHIPGQLSVFSFAEIPGAPVRLLGSQIHCVQSLNIQ